MTPTRKAVLLTCAALALVLSAAPSVEARKKMLIYTYTQGFHHYSIPTATKAVQQLAKTANPPIDTVHSDDPRDFERDNWLSQFDMLMFISVSGKALSPDGAEAMRKYIEAGGGYMGVHEACDALYEQHWYGRLVGAYFNYHPQITHATLDIVNRTHPSTQHLNATWRVYDEMYNFNSNPSKWGKQRHRSDQAGDPIGHGGDGRRGKELLHGAGTHECHVERSRLPTAHHGCSVLAHGLARAQVVVAQPSCGRRGFGLRPYRRTDQHGNQPQRIRSSPRSLLHARLGHTRALLEICTLQEWRRVVAGCIVVSYLHRSRAGVVVAQPRIVVVSLAPPEKASRSLAFCFCSRLRTVPNPLSPCCLALCPRAAGPRSAARPR
ncbi:hypothetical protein L1887_54790 [Cichorium endivia]|nr:hypothetical protein L1887_54790 [Cichorium endivia]